jgi:cytochrome c oxidase subunit 2
VANSCSFLEIVWTIIPTALLIVAGYPGISLLYALDEHIDADFWVKVVGHQWYWTYEYPMFENSDGRWLVYDSSPISPVDPILFGLPANRPSEVTGLAESVNTKPDLSNRYISVDNPMILPARYQIQAVISSSDVIHSW